MPSTAPVACTAAPWAPSVRSVGDLMPASASAGRVKVYIYVLQALREWCGAQVCVAGIFFYLEM